MSQEPWSRPTERRTMANGRRRSRFHSLHPYPPVLRPLEHGRHRHALARSAMRTLVDAAPKDGREEGGREEVVRGRLRSQRGERTDGADARKGRSASAGKPCLLCHGTPGETANKTAAPSNSTLLKTTRDGAITSRSFSRGTGPSVRGMGYLAATTLKNNHHCQPMPPFWACSP